MLVAPSLPVAPKAPSTLDPPAEGAQPCVIAAPKAIGRIAWVAADCPLDAPQGTQPSSTQAREVPMLGAAGIASVNLSALDRFTLLPIRDNADQQHRARLPYVFMHVVGRRGPRHRSIPRHVAEPLLALNLVPSERHRLDPPELSYDLQYRPAHAHIDAIDFFALVGALPRVHALGTLGQCGVVPLVRLVITTLLLAERGEPLALLRAALLFAHGLGVDPNPDAARTYRSEGFARGATADYAAAARAQLLWIPGLAPIRAVFSQVPTAPMPTELATCHHRVGTLAYAVRLGSMTTVCALVQYGLDVDVNWPTCGANHDAGQMQPLYAATLFAGPRMLMLLLRHSMLHTRDTADAARDTIAHARFNQLRAFVKDHASNDMLTTLDMYKASDASATTLNIRDPSSAPHPA